MEYLAAFIVGGVICFLGQALLDLVRLSPIHTLCVLVTLGAMLDGFHLYDRIIDFGGAGAILPITSFGHSFVHGAMQEGGREGFIGIGMGMFEVTSGGLSSAILFSFLAAIFFKARG
ncbi:stage V sporulation protein AE [Alkalihalobacillus pseudalcaliphilus]|uniref:stage V sporulation protein AE n=1 Tax=Alkalihalobacillus pseudalcaliphilus TaxID=79884 RepID=UPI00064DFCA3|nr:stage V sporulation protein AE [Alkalihalobacillus pseudalcaliphilus]KMK76113.1 stage V sporulation protein AEB [Alkalihalobacillus pseudalcaliphilus]